MISNHIVSQLEEDDNVNKDDSSIAEADSKTMELVDKWDWTINTQDNLHLYNFKELEESESSIIVKSK